MVKELVKDIKKNLIALLNDHPHCGLTIHDVIKGIVFSYIQAATYLYAIPEVSKYKRVGNRSLKRRADLLVVDRNINPLVVIEIDRMYKENNEQTLELWGCHKLWIGCSSKNRIKCSNKEIDIFNIVDNGYNPKLKLPKKLLRNL